MNINQLTANKIRETRQKLQLSAEHVAHELQIDKSNYSKLENGKVEINMNRLQELADIFKVSLSSLMPFDDKSIYNIKQANYSFNDYQVHNQMISPDLIEILQKTADTLTKVVEGLKQQ